MFASGTIGGGLIKTVNSANPFFCLNNECFYNVWINLNNIDRIIFLASLFDNGALIEFKKSLEIVEELE